MFRNPNMFQYLSGSMRLSKLVTFVAHFNVKKKRYQLGLRSTSMLVSQYSPKWESSLRRAVTHHCRLIRSCGRNSRPLTREESTVFYSSSSVGRKGSTHEKIKCWNRKWGGKRNLVIWTIMELWGRKVDIAAFCPPIWKVVRFFYCCSSLLSIGFQEHSSNNQNTPIALCQSYTATYNNEWSRY